MPDFHERVVVGGGARGGLHMHGTPMLNVHGLQAAAIADLAAITGGDAPTEAEHNAVRTAVNSILAALRGVGVIAAS